MSRHNFNHCGLTHEKTKKILKVLESYPEGLQPKSISVYAEIAISSCKQYLALLKNIGICYQEYPRGPYKIAKNLMHSMEEPRIQNIVVIHKIEAAVKERIERPYDFKIATASLQIGQASSKATFRLAANPPISIRQAIIFIGVFKEEIKQLFGYSPPDETITITTAEFNWDYAGMRIDGANAITLKGLTTIEKLYMKPNNWLRHEMKTIVPFGFDNLITMLNRGQQSSDINASMLTLYTELHGIKDMIRRLGGDVLRKSFK